MSYSQQVLYKKPSKESSSAVTPSVFLKVALESNQPSLMPPRRTHRDTQSSLASNSPEMTKAALGSLNKHKLKAPQRVTICPNRLWLPSVGKCAKTTHVLLVKTRKTVLWTQEPKGATWDTLTWRKKMWPVLLTTTTREIRHLQVWIY